MGKSLGVGCIKLPPGNRLDTGPDYLGDICAVIDSHADDAQKEFRHPPSDDIRKATVVEEYLNYQRCILEKFHIDSGNDFEYFNFCGGQHAEDNT